MFVSEFQKFTPSTKTFVNNSTTIEERFFEIESDIEKKAITRKYISMDPKIKNGYYLY